MLPTALPPSATALPGVSRGSAPGSPPMAVAPGGEAGGVRRRTWWGGRRKARMPGQPSAFAAAAQAPQVQRPKSVYSKSQVVGDFIKDKQWGSQPMKQGLKAGEGAPARVKGALSVSKNRSSSAQNLVALAPAVAPLTQVMQPEAAGVPPSLNVAVGSVEGSPGMQSHETV